MRFQTIIISAILILWALTSCRDKGTEPYVKSIWLSAEDIGVMDAAIHVLISNDSKPGNFSLKLNGKTILSANARDTLIFSDSLLPKHTYTYKAYRLNGAIVFDSSEALTITTMDTTSHNFTWMIDTLFGDGVPIYSHSIEQHYKVAVASYQENPSYLSLQQSKHKYYL